MIILPFSHNTEEITQGGGVGEGAESQTRFLLDGFEVENVPSQGK